MPVSLSPEEMAAAEVAARILGASVDDHAEAHEVSLVYPDGRKAALEEATLGDREDIRPARLRRESELQWPAPARWWWRVAIKDVRTVRRVREVFPVVARTCEAYGAPSPSQLPAGLVSTVPDLHWLVHTGPAHLVGSPEPLGRPATVTLCPGGATGRMTSVVPALRESLSSGPAARALSLLAPRTAQEHQLYLTVGCTGLAADALDALARSPDVPPAPPPFRPGLTHLWLAPVLGRAVFLWSRHEGWSRHEPYD